MQLLRRLDGSAGSVPGLAATIGGFDGIHRGHRALIDRTRAAARARGLSSLVVTFEPLPREYFAKDSPPPRLTTFRERWRLLEHDGPDWLCVLPFNDRLRNQTAEEFARLLQRAGVRQLVIGHDFRAGRNGLATTEWFVGKGPSLGMAVEVVAPVQQADLRISSRAVREALGRGDLDAAALLLGRRYSMRGRVVRGEQLGRKLGFPTANLRLGRRCSPMDGIFAVRVRVRGDQLPGVASLGTRPTVGGRVPLLEAHVFDFDADLYGREIEVGFVARLRGVRKIDSVGSLVT